MIIELKSMNGLIYIYIYININVIIIIIIIIIGEIERKSN